MPATLAAAERNKAEAARGGEEDFSAVIRLMEELTEQDRFVPPSRDERLETEPSNRSVNR
jgi:hypothetical protein